VHFMAFPELQSGEGNFFKTIHAVGQRNFFQGLELGVIFDHIEREKVSQAISDYGFSVGFGVQPIILRNGLNLNSLRVDEREYAIEQLKPYINQAAELHVDRFVILSGQDPGDERRPEAYQVLADSIVRLGEYSKQYGIAIVLESFDRAVDKKALVGPSLEAAVLAHEIRKTYPNFGLLYDMGHMPLLDEKPYEALEVLKDYLAEVHVGNCVNDPQSPIYGDLHPCFGYAGGVNGTQELIEFIKALFKTGYLNEAPTSEELPWVGFEIRPHIGQTTEEILENIQSTWTDAWSQL
jgi:sugar phosphate isomerase/epimerase